MPYRIEPGSELDRAIDTIVAQSVSENAAYLPSLGGLVDPQNEDHLRIIGTRFFLRRHYGIKGVEELTPSERVRWYGGETPSKE